MEQEIIDLSHLTAEERAKLVAVIEADEELRLNCLSVTGSDLNERSSGNDKNIELQQLHLKLERDHRYSSELLRRSLTAAPEQRRENGGHNLSDLDSHNDHDVHLLTPQSVKVCLDDLPAVKAYEKDEGNTCTLQKLHSKSSSVESLKSLTSMYSAPAGKGNYDITGKLQVGVWYNNGQLLVQVVMAKGLAAAKKEGISNPYVKMYLLPDLGKCTKRKTGVQRKTTNPVFDEILKVKIEQSALSSRTLWLSVWDWDIFGRNRFLGEIRLPLSSLDLSVSKDYWYSLLDKRGTVFHNDSYQGKLQVGLMYLPKAKLVSSSNNTTRIIGTLHIAIYQAQNLLIMDEDELTDPTVKLYLLPNQSLSGKRKTRVISHNLNPVWNEQFTYKNVYLDDLSSGRVLEVTVWDYDRRGSNGFIGGVRMGPHPDSLPHLPKDWMDSAGDEVTHWEAMLKQPGEWVEQWHTLRLSMEPASKYSPLSSSVRAVKSSGTNRESTTLEIVKHSSVPSTTPLPHDHELLPSSTHNHSPFPRDQLSPLPAPSIPSFPCEQLNHSQYDSTSGKSVHKKTTYDITGEVLVGVYYQNGQLHIHVERARGLAAADSNGYSDPYIKTYLLPDKAKHTKQKTSVKKKTLNPVYNETLRYKVPESDLGSRILWLSAWDWDRFNKNQCLGEIYLSLPSLDLSDTTDHWYQLQDKLKTDDDLPSGSPTSLQRSLQLNGAETAESTSTNLHLVTVVVEEDSNQLDRSSNLNESLSSLSSTSVYSEAGGRGKYDITGEVLVGVYYQNGQLHIHVERARGLAAADSNGYSNPYVKTYLLPDKHTKQKTSIKKKTLDPVYNEEVIYDISKSGLSSRSLLLTVWDWSRFGRSQFLGEVCLPLSSLELTDSCSQPDQWYLLQDKEASAGEEDSGELKVGLKYQPVSGLNPTGTLVINIMQAKELQAMDIYSNDSVVKLYLLPNRKSSEKRKTGIIKNSINPLWEEKFTFENVSLEELSCERVLEISVWSYDNSSHTFIGGLRLGPAPGSAAKHKDWMDSIGDEVTHWEDMLANPGEWVEQWHTLRSSMNPRDDLDLYTCFSIVNES